ncbi:MAG: hypothetical protein ACREU9_11650 [Gammaproteobacteria bacterium]
MTIRIKLMGVKYNASVSPPHAKVDWNTREPLPLRDLIAKLEVLGCHVRDIGDALYEADPEWEDRLGDSA